MALESVRQWVRLFAFCALAVGLAPCWVRGSGVIEYTFNVPDPAANPAWSETFAVPQFDPVATGKLLLGIEFEVTATIVGDVVYENVDPVANDILAVLSTVIDIERPDDSLIATVTPTWSQTETVDAYDGFTDFGGVSGRTYGGRTGTDAAMHNSPPPSSDMALFQGSGTVTLEAIAVGETFSVTGDGNKQVPVSGLNNQVASATVIVRYIIPEPASAVLLGCAMLGALLRRRRS